MLTNLFYYDYYKPYIFKNEKLVSKYNITAGSSAAPVNKENFDADGDGEFSFFLNKAYKSEVVRYAENISKDFNSIKNIARSISYKMKDPYFAFENKRELIAESLDELTEKYNTYKDFAFENAKHSPILNSFFESLKYRVDFDAETLSVFGISENEEERLIFDRNAFDSMSVDDFERQRDGLEGFCDSVYNDTCEVMTVPMEEHMNFKNLNFYYNYIYSSEEHNTVKIIETGMLVDISL